VSSSFLFYRGLSSGHVIEAIHQDATSRVSLPGSDGFDLALAMSRSLGDQEGKTPGYLVAEPTVKLLDLTSLSKGSSDEKPMVFAVVASDGLVDVIPAQDLANVLGKAMFGELTNGKDRATVLEDICHALMGEADRLWGDKHPIYRDDISFAISKLEF